MPFSSGTVTEPNSSYSFALTTFEKLLEETPAGENLCYSPFGVEIILSIIHALAPEDDRAEIERLFTFGSESPQECLLDIHRKRRAYIEIPGIHILSSLWLRAPERLPEAVGTKLQTEFATDSYTRDFDSETVREINDWADRNTDGRITDIVSDLSRVLRLAVNAIYFNCAWEKFFTPGLTRPSSFRLHDGSEVQRPRMLDVRSFLYHEDLECQAVQLDYKNQRFSMRVILPREGIYLPTTIRGSARGDWMRQLQNTPGWLGLPRFSCSSQPPISLDKLGLRSRRDMELRQDTYIRVNEEGTEAGTATQMLSFGRTAGPQPFRMTVDRPFYFLICDNFTDTILFIGRIADPGKE